MGLAALTIMSVARVGKLFALAALLATLANTDVVWLVLGQEVGWVGARG